jgi:hypothetical protein
MSLRFRLPRLTPRRRRPRQPGVVRPPTLALARRHPAVTAMVLAVLMTGLVFAIPAVYSLAFPPALNCGPGMVIAGSPPSCVGVSLGFGQFTAKDPARLRALEHQVQGIDEKVQRYYVSVVLLLDLSPVAGTDTVDYPSLYPNIEGAITAAWQADNTSAFGTTPAVKLYLANMGSRYRWWREAVSQILANRAARHITSVVGLGQSTTQTRSAAALLGSAAHLPVIGATVTGDSMNLKPATSSRNQYFFRVSPPNSAEVRGIAQYVSTALHLKPPTAVVIEDTPGDAYESTLAAVAPGALKAVGLTVYKPLQYESGGEPPGESRETYLGNAFSEMQDNLCQLNPSLVFFAGRGEDLDAFARSWADERGCQQAGAPPLRIVSGDDAAAVVGDPVVRRAIQQGRITLTYITLANADMWGGTCTGAKTDFDEFLAAFTGQKAGCGADAMPGSPRFRSADLANGQAVPTHDAVLVAVKAARGAQGNAPVQSQLVAVANPESQLNSLINFRCTTMLGGADGFISFGTDHNPIDHPLPIVQLSGSGRVVFNDLTWPDGGPVLNLPARGAGCGLNG